MYIPLTRSKVTILIIVDVWQVPHISGRFCIITVISSKFPLQLNITVPPELAKLLPPVEPARGKMLIHLKVADEFCCVDAKEIELKMN